MGNSNNYTNSFSRNIGTISKEEQDILSNTTIAIAGLGGIGGAAVTIFARMGISHFKIADIDTFDIKNLNRQVGSTHSALGKTKVEVIRDMIMEINPEATVECFSDGVQQYNAEEFVKGANLVLDSIDYFCFTPRNILQTTCHQLNIPVVFSAPLGLSATFMMFTPESMSFQEYFNFKKGQTLFDKLILFTIGIAPSATHLKYMDFAPERLTEIQTGPSLCPSVHLGGALIAVEALKYLTGKAKPCIAPNYIQIDLLQSKVVKKKLRWGNKGPIQRLKAFFANKKYISFKPAFLEFIK